jgi:acyl carrier protein/GNAT superfamily N-acetyltransferase
LGIDPEILTERSSPDTVASWDSLNHLNLVMALESEYEISLSPEDAPRMHDVGAIRKILAEYQSETEASVPTEGEISFVDCRIEQVPALKAFIAKSYGAGYVLGINDAYFRWQYGGTPVSQANDYHLRLAIVDGQIAGCLGYIPVEISLGGRVLHGNWLANWMVDPDQRHLGLGPLLVREVTRQFEVTLALGPNKDARDILERMGWTDFGLLPRYVRVLDIDRARLLTETGELDWPGPATSTGGHPAPGATIRLVDRLDQRATQLWDQCLEKSHWTAGTRRTADFLNWRYADHPQFPYRLFEARHQGRLTGLAVYRIEQARGLSVRVGRLVEFISEPEFEAQLLSAVLDDARSHEAAAIDFFCTSHQMKSVMMQHGFLPGDHEAAKQIPILYQPINRRRAGIRFMADLQNVNGAGDVHQWYVAKADGDQDRPN